MPGITVFLRALIALLAMSSVAGAAAQITPVVEYYNHALDRYFLTADAQEIGDLDSGRTAGWARSGYGFSAYLVAMPGANPVCRFYIPPAFGDSHFFSASPDECAEIQRTFPQFVLESPAVFYMPLPDTATGACPAGTVPVYRLWGQSAGVSHRYTTDVSIRDEMLSQEYVAEGYGPDATAMCSPTSSPALPLESATVFAGPLRIVAGGTYTGNWESQDPATPAIVVDTTEPVVITNCVLRGRANLISVGVEGVDVTVRNCRGYGLDPGVAGQERGAFFEAYRVARLTFEHNYMEGLAEGVVLIEYGGSASGGPAVTIRYNRVRNLMGLYSDGQGGVQLSGDLGNEGNGNHVVILDKLQQLPGAEIGWNEIVNDPYLSSVGDKVNIYRSSGTVAAPIVIHDNFIRGGYGVIPTTPEYSGGGVITDGGSDDDAQSATAFVEIHDNQFVSGPNFGAAIDAGHDIEVFNNRTVSTGQLGDGEWIATPYGNGFNVWNGYNQSGDVYFNNTAHDNVAGWVIELTDGSGARVPPPVRHDYYLPDCASGGCIGNVSLPDPVQAASEESEYALWVNKLASGGVAIGPMAPSP